MTTAPTVHDPRWLPIIVQAMETLSGYGLPKPAGAGLPVNRRNLARWWPWLCAIALTLVLALMFGLDAMP